jgi:hypothetical protein
MIDTPSGVTITEAMAADVARRYELELDHLGPKGHVEAMRRALQAALQSTTPAKAGSEERLTLAEKIAKLDASIKSGASVQSWYSVRKDKEVLQSIMYEHRSVIVDALRRAISEAPAVDRDEK